MREPEPAQLPLLCRALIAAAGWMVPHAERARWLRKWRDQAGHWWAFLNEREEFLLQDGYRHLLRHCVTAFSDAFWLRFRRERLREFLRGPSFVLLAALAVLAATGLGSGGFSMLRSLRAPLPYPEPERLVTISQPGVIGPFGVPGVQIRRWSEKSRTLKGIGGYRVATFRHGYATAPLFQVAGIQAEVGRIFEPGDRRAAMISHSYWRDVYKGDRRVLGRTIRAEDERFVPIIGVLPPSNRIPGLPDLPVWTVTDPDDAPAWKLFTTVGRLAPGVTRERAEKELWRLARGEKVRVVGEIRLSQWRTPVQGRVLLWIAFPTFGLVVGLILAALSKQSPVAGHVPPGRRARCWGFLVVKTALVLGALTVFWIEALTACAVRSPESDLREFVNLAMALVPTLTFLAGCALATLWCVVDQRKRCPVCLTRLALPVTLGSWSSSLLDPVTTEFVCEHGHGALSIPETGASSAERDRWTEMDESWQDLFTRT